MCTGVLSPCMCAFHIHAYYPKKPEGGVRSLGAEVTDGCEVMGGCWELSLGPLEEQSLLLTTEPSLQAGKQLGEKCCLVCMKKTQGLVPVIKDPLFLCIGSTIMKI